MKKRDSLSLALNSFSLLQMKKPDCFTNEVRKALKAAFADLDKRAFPYQPPTSAAAAGGSGAASEAQSIQQQQQVGGPSPPKTLPLYDGIDHPAGSVFVCHKHMATSDFAQLGVLLVDGEWI
jgi:hypothetical protein